MVAALGFEFACQILRQWEMKQGFQKQRLTLPLKHVSGFQRGAVSSGKQNQSSEYRVSQGCRSSVDFQFPCFLYVAQAYSDLARSYLYVSGLQCFVFFNSTF